MPASFNEKLIKILKKDSRFVDDEGEILRAAVIDRAWKIDHELIRLLLTDAKIKEKFFDEIEGHWIFNINTFIDYISDKNFLDNSYTRFRNRIGLNIDGKFLRERGEVSLVWPYKDCVLEGGQTKEEEKRKEIFFNEILAQDEIDRLFDPKVLTNWKRYTPDGIKKVSEIKRDEDDTIRENLIIKGNNLLALHTLKTLFRGKVKLIFVDPPYNREVDTFYNDNFKRSSWLTFMKNRLEVAKDFLSDDGAIFMQIDDTQQAYLKVLCDEIFGEDNFNTVICVKMSHLSGVKMAHKELKLPKIKEYILMYTKRPGIKLNPQYEPASWDAALERYNSFVVKHKYGDDNCDKWEIISLNIAMKIAGIDLDDNKSVLDFKLKNAHLIFRTARNRSADYSHLPKDKFNKVLNPDGSYYFVYKNEDVNFASEKVIEIDGKATPVNAIGDIWTDIGINNLSNEGGVDLRFGKKPEKLIHRIIEIITINNFDIVMDFFLGCGTTCAVAHKMGRQYIGIEQLEYGENDSVHRLQNVIGKRKKKGLFDEYEDYDTSGISKTVNWKGGGDFIYCELMKYNDAFMDKIQEAKTSKELVKLWKEIAKNSFLNWYVNPEAPEDTIKDFEEIGKGEDGLKKQKKLLAELLNKNQLYVNLFEIDDKQFSVSSEDRKLNRLFYGDRI